jgi:hypothetical protein
MIRTACIATALLASALLPSASASAAVTLNGRISQIVHALRDGWMLLQSAQLIPPAPGTEHLNAYLDYEFVFERRVDV